MLIKRRLILNFTFDADESDAAQLGHNLESAAHHIGQHDILTAMTDATVSEWDFNIKKGAPDGMPYRAELARSDRLLTADELQEKYSTERDNGEHPQYLRRDWRHEVAEGDTLRGYWQWVEAQIEQADD
jgi:hypothetical protein